MLTAGARSAVAWVGGGLAVVSMLALQTQLYSGQVRMVATVFMFVALAQSWNIIGGFAGYASFGQVVFFGLGGYTTAVLMTKIGVNFWLSLIASGLLSGIFAAVISLPLLRLKGHYFAVATLGVAEGLRELVINMPAVTGGGAGISIPVVGPDAPTDYLGNDGFYVLFLLLAAMSCAGVGLLSRSRLGYALRAIHEDEDGAAAVGVNTTRAKILAFGLSGMLGGLVGGVYAFQQVAIYPQRLFDVEISMLVVVMVVIGGSGTVVGPVLGAVGLQALSEFLRVNLVDIHTLVLGAAVIVAVMLIPQGVVPLLGEKHRTRRLSLLDTVRSYRL